MKMVSAYKLFGALVSLLPNIENLRRLLLGQAGESRSTDNALEYAWLGKSAYGLSNAKLAHLLARLDETFFFEKLEHISLRNSRKSNTSCINVDRA